MTRFYWQRLGLRLPTVNTTPGLTEFHKAKEPSLGTALSDVCSMPATRGSDPIDVAAKSLRPLNCGRPEPAAKG